jgi:hypothetical protein
MSPFLASHLVFDSDQEALFEASELSPESIWRSVRIYKSHMQHVASYEVWLVEWDAIMNKEKLTFTKTFENFEDAKMFGLNQLKDFSPQKMTI